MTSPRIDTGVVGSRSWLDRSSCAILVTAGLLWGTRVTLENIPWRFSEPYADGWLLLVSDVGMWGMLPAGIVVLLTGRRELGFGHALALALGATTSVVGPLFRLWWIARVTGWRAGDLSERTSFWAGLVCEMSLPLVAAGFCVGALVVHCRRRCGGRVFAIQGGLGARLADQSRRG